jgi:hypothetical protein
LPDFFGTAARRVDATRNALSLTPYSHAVMLETLASAGVSCFLQPNFLNVIDADS